MNLKKMLYKWEGERFVNNKYFQVNIEDFCIDRFKLLGSKSTFTYNELQGVQLYGVTNELSIYIMDKLEVIKKYLEYIPQTYK